MRAHGTFGQPNPFAGYLVLFFPIAFALWAFGDLEARLTVDPLDVPVWW